MVYLGVKKERAASNASQLISLRVQRFLTIYHYTSKKLINLMINTYTFNLNL